MQHLTPVGLSPDGKDLVLVSASGEEFVVPADHRLRAALRGDPARPGHLEMKMESALRPRDIQARIRAGESAEEVAAAAQTTVDAIMAFAAPVLAERAHIAATALKCSIRRATTEATPGARTLDDASRQHLMALAVRADDVEWDAWRRDDGRWALVAEYIAGDDLHRAEFTYDQPGRYVLADNDEARLLTGEAVLQPPAPEPSRRLSSVPDSGDELPLGDFVGDFTGGSLGDDALAMVSEPGSDRPSTPEPETLDVPRSIVREQEQVASPVEQTAPTEPDAAAEHATTDLSETAAAIRATAPAHDEQASFDDLAGDHADADWIATIASAPASPAAPQLPADESDTDPDEPADELPVPAEETAPARKKGRSSVPSWDEIMFGGGKHE
ncbi:MAG: hypothetical protein JWQ74_3376 [Marmoricola sp.]|nr:hypothetical protein [Marmoricola sp.]